MENNISSDYIKQIKEMTEKLNYYRCEYYNNNNSVISDKEYDELFDKLVLMEEENNFYMSNSPTRNVGYTVMSKLEKTIHSHPMLSLGKTKDVSELVEFAGDKDCILSLKCDGLSCLLTYENGELIKAETRGDGYKGENITHNARVIKNIPLKIPYTDHLEIEGEAVIFTDDFDRINNGLNENEKFKTPRNLVSGSIRQLDSKIASERNIKFIVWKVPTNISTAKDVTSDNTYNHFVNRLNFAKYMGFDVVPFLIYCKEADEEHINDMIESLKNYANKNYIPIDGLVMTYDDIKYGESLGATGHHPKHSTAFKFYDEEYETKLKDIIFDVSKYGTLTPVAVFEPVEIDGTIVEKASLCNMSIVEKTLGKYPYYGETIYITKRNNVIPFVERAENVLNNPNKILDIDIENLIPVPQRCPVCGKPTKIMRNNNTDILVCTNDKCKGKLVGTISHFCSKDAINIEGMSDKTIEKLIDTDCIERFEDIYELENNFGAFIKFKLNGFGEKSANKLFDAIEKSRYTTLDRFIYSLSIPLIGKTASKAIAKYFNYNYDKFVKACQHGFNFAILEDFGDTMNDSLNDYLDKNIGKMNYLARYFYFEEPNTNNNSNKLEGKNFVITGSVHIFKNRDEVKEKIESLGGKVVGSVSKNTSYLINNDINSNSGKNKKAKEIGISIITEEDFVNMIK